MSAWGGKEAAQVVRRQSETGDLLTSDLASSSRSALEPQEVSKRWEESMASSDASSRSSGVQVDDDLQDLQDLQDWWAAMCPHDTNYAHRIRIEEAGKIESREETKQGLVVNALDQTLHVQLAYTADQVAKGHTALPRFIVLQPQFQSTSIVLSVFSNAAGVEGHQVSHLLGLGPSVHQNDRTEERGRPVDENVPAMEVEPELRSLWDHLLCDCCGDWEKSGEIWVPSFCEMLGFFGLIFGVMYLDYTHMAVAALTLHSLFPT